MKLLHATLNYFRTREMLYTPVDKPVIAVVPGYLAVGLIANRYAVVLSVNQKYRTVEVQFTMSGRTKALLQLLKERGTINVQAGVAADLITLEYATIARVETDGSYTLEITTKGAKSSE